MKTSIIIRLDEDLERLIDQVSQRAGRTRSDVIRDALRREFTILMFEQLRQEVLPFAEARGYLTDEDVFRGVS
jgi:predicted transcriptional regulator